VVDVFVDLVQHQIEAGCFAVVACPFPEWRLERVVGDQQPTGEPPSSAGCR